MIEIKLKTKIEVIIAILNRLNPSSSSIKTNNQPNASDKPVQPKTSMLSSLGSSAYGAYKSMGNMATDVYNSGSKFFLANDHKKKILNALTVINNLLTIYNSQFDWTIRANEHFFKYIRVAVKKDAKSDTGAKADKDAKAVKDEEKKPIMDIIWDEILTSNEFKAYMIQEEPLVPVKAPLQSSKKGGGKNILRRKSKIKRRNMMHRKSKINRRNTVKRQRRTRYVSPYLQ